MKMEISLGDNVPGARNFYWHEFLKLRMWDIYVYPNSEQYYNLMRLAEKMQLIRDFFGRPIEVTSCLRPRVYNEMIGGSRRSAHISGNACDFVVEGFEGRSGCDTVRKILADHLDAFEVRMENLPGSNWIHIDLRSPGMTGRFFEP